MVFAPNEYSDQSGHPLSLIRVFTVRMKNAGSSATYWAHCEDWSDWMDAPADLSLRWAQRPCCWFCHEAAHLTDHKLHNAKIPFVMSWLSHHFNPHLPSGLVHPYQSIGRIHFQFEGCLVYFFIFILFQIDIPVGKQWRPWSDAVFCSIWSGSELFFLCPKNGMLGLYGLICSSFIFQLAELVF